MSFNPELAEIRFGCGLSPDIAAHQDLASVLAGLSAPDDMAERFPIGGFDTLDLRLAEVGRARKAAKTAAQKKRFRTTLRNFRQKSNDEGTLWYTQSLQRWIRTNSGLRERLTGFWADHFTAVGKNSILRFATAPYVEDAIRPNITGTFADLLIGAITHPLMLQYLDQGVSVGPGSVIATRAKNPRGLNENLAREVMELHTLGVDGPYTQADVRELAELFTGLSYARGNGFKFRRTFAEPGQETVLGVLYGDDPASVEPVLQVLRDLADHPATARHIAQKLAVHFVSDTPDPDLVRYIATRFKETGGDLMAVTTAMLEHAASWQAGLGNVKPPADFVASACRALAIGETRLSDLPARMSRHLLMTPLKLMGQPWHRPSGPDGWSEADTDWVTPQGVSTRLGWALSVPQRLRPDLPDPKAFAASALGSFAPQAVQFAAQSAETRPDAIGLVLASPAFQRR